MKNLQIKSKPYLHSNFELFMKGMYMLNPVLIGNRKNTTVFLVQCDAVRETEEEAKAYLVAQELMK